MKRYIPILLGLLVATSAHAQSFSERAQAYVTKYKDWAIAEQQRSGVPAAITLAQGIHETNAGTSELATNANNHFGIKCKKEWTGDTYAYTDDAENECFRKYKSALESYHDHSNYLRKGNRYAPCFALDARDYKGWAHALKRCGYATNKSYAQILIRLVEDYQLEAYTEQALNRQSNSTAFVASTASPVAAALMAEADTGKDAATTDTPSQKQHDYGKLMKKDGIRGFWARQGDVLLEYAIQFKLRYSKLLEMNGLPDAPLAKDQFIYIERGGSFDRLMAKDPSTPSSAGAVSTATETDTNTFARKEPPARTIPSTHPSSNPDSDAMPAHPMNAAQATAASEDRIFAQAVANSNTATTPPPDTTPTATNTEKPFNIANEKAVEELPSETNTKTARNRAQTADAEKTSPELQEKPIEPQDEFSRLKARLDKVVYAPSSNETKSAQTLTDTPAPANPAPANPAPEYHTVKSGETAYGIAKKYQISMQQLLDLNKMSFGSEIKVGQKLRVK